MASITPSVRMETDTHVLTKTMAAMVSLTLHKRQENGTGLFKVDKTWEQPRCPSTDGWIKTWYIYKM